LALTVVTPTEVLATHLLEVLKSNFPRLLTLRSLRRLLDEFVRVSDRDRAEANRRLLDELVPDRVPVDLLLSVLRLLLEERVSIRNLPLILEATAEARFPGASAEAIAEHVRQRLGFQLVAELRREDGTLPLIQLAPEWEDTFRAHQIDAAAAAPTWPCRPMSSTGSPAQWPSAWPRPERGRHEPRPRHDRAAPPLPADGRGDARPRHAGPVLRGDRARRAPALVGLVAA
jgi:hypothetical protein